MDPIREEQQRLDRSIRSVRTGDYKGQYPGGNADLQKEHGFEYVEFNVPEYSAEELPSFFTWRDQGPTS